MDYFVKKSDNSFEYRLYFKTCHSGSILPYTSHIGRNVKRGIIVGEIRRAINRSSGPDQTIQSLALVFRRFCQNGYPMQLLKDCMIMYSQRTTSDVEKKKKKSIFINVPFLNDFFSSKFKRMLYALNLQDIIDFYSTSKNLSVIFSHNKQRLQCENICKFCKISEKPNICYYKNVVYLVTCSICSSAYVGQTHRFLRTRVHEHFTRDESAVYKHHQEHDTCIDIFGCFRINVLHTNLHDQRVRTYVESIYINKYSNTLMNGCMSTAPICFSS